MRACNRDQRAFGGAERGSVDANAPGVDADAVSVDEVVSRRDGAAFVSNDDPEDANTGGYGKAGAAEREYEADESDDEAPNRDEAAAWSETKGWK